MKQRFSVKTLLLDLLFDIVGCGLFALSIQLFCAPHQIAPGGVSGISILVEYLFGLPISAVSFALNIPLFLLGWIFLGKWFALKTLKTVAILTVMLELATWIPVYRGDIILAALYGGVLQGIGIAMVFARGSTTGGTDVASRLIQKAFPHVSVGKIMMGVDGLVLAASAIVFRSVESILYAMIVIFVTSQLIDRILYGMDTGKVLMIISKHHLTIAARINREMERGCTVIQGQGSYTNEDRPVLLCAVRKQQYIRLKRVVWDTDPYAFMFALEATEIIGEGFHNDIQR